MDQTSFDLLRGFLGFTNPLGENIDDACYTAANLLQKVDQVEDFMNRNVPHFMETKKDVRAMERLEQIAQPLRDGADDKDSRYKLANALSWCMQAYGNAAQYPNDRQMRKGAMEDAVHMMQ